MDLLHWVQWKALWSTIQWLTCSLALTQQCDHMWVIEPLQELMPPLEVKRSGAYQSEVKRHLRSEVKCPEGPRQRALWNTIILKPHRGLVARCLSAADTINQIQEQKKDVKGLSDAKRCRHHRRGFKLWEVIMAAAFLFLMTSMR